MGINTYLHNMKSDAGGESAMFLHILAHIYIGLSGHGNIQYQPSWIRCGVLYTFTFFPICSSGEFVCTKQTQPDLYY